MATKYDESKDILDSLNTQFEEIGVMSDEWDYKSNFTDKEIELISKKHDITYDVIQKSNDDTTQTEVIIFKKKERERIMAYTSEDLRKQIRNFSDQTDSMIIEEIRKGLTELLAKTYEKGADSR